MVLIRSQPPLRLVDEVWVEPREAQPIDEQLDVEGRHVLVGPRDGVSMQVDAARPRVVVLDKRYGWYAPRVAVDVYYFKSSVQNVI